MSDAPPPPPDGTPPMPPPPTGPPPPPPDLIAPAGYAGYEPSPMRAVSLHRTGRLALAAMALATISALFSLGSVWALDAAQDDAEQLLADEISAETFVEGALPYFLVSLVQGIAVLAAAVVTMIWMFRVAANHRSLHRNTTWAPGWAIGGWFLPPFLYVIPMLMLREMWKAADPAVAIGDDWRSRPASPLIAAWFVFYSIVPIVLLFTSTSTGLGNLGASERDLAEQITSTQSSALVGALVAMAGAATFIAVVHGISRRHQQFTGEAN